VTLKTWRRLAALASVFNVAGAVFAIAAGEGWHAGIHVSLALGFGFAAQRLGEIDRKAAPHSIQAQLEAQAAALEEAEAMLALQAKQLTELEERVDFAERVLAQARDKEKPGS
jgi:hypothetical protein